MAEKKKKETPKRADKAVMIRVPIPMYQELSGLAKRWGLPLGSVARMLIIEAMSERGITFPREEKEQES